MTHESFSPPFTISSPDGSELLANLGGEQLYLFDLHESEKPKRLDMSLLDTNGHNNINNNGKGKTLAPRTQQRSSNGDVEDDSDSGGSGSFSEHYETNIKQVKLMDDAAATTSSMGAASTSGSPTKSSHSSLIESLKEKGNQAFNRQHYSSAIALYNEALAVEPASLIYANRAAALMNSVALRGVGLVIFGLQ